MHTFRFVLATLFLCTASFAQEKAAYENLRKFTTSYSDTTFSDSLIIKHYVRVVEYNQKGLEIHNRSSVNGVVDSETRYFYDEDGLLLDEKDYDSLLTSSTSSIVHYEYDKKKNLKRETFFSFNTFGATDSLKRIYDYFNTYDTNGNLISTVEKDGDIEKFRSHIAYYPNGKRKCTDELDFSADEYVRHTCYYYGETGLLLFKTQQDSSGWADVGSRDSTFYYYDKAGKLSMSFTHPGIISYFSNDHLDSTFVFHGKDLVDGEIRMYDKAGHLLLKKFLDAFENEIGELHSSWRNAEEYTYDQQGNMVRRWCYCDNMNIVNRCYYSKNLLQKNEEIRNEKVTRTTYFEYEMF